MVQNTAVPVGSVRELRLKISPETEMVLIEEAQFFDESILTLVVELADAGSMSSVLAWTRFSASAFGDRCRNYGGG